MYKRYYELVRNIERINHLKGEFSVEPEIIVVWAAPEIGRLWLFQDLLKNGKIHHLITREATSEDGVLDYTTYMEGLNFQTAFDFINKNYSDFYIIGQAADVFVFNGIYKEFDKYIQEGYDAVLIARKFGALGTSKAWTTNLFAIRNNPQYYPPFEIRKKGGSAMEHRWGTKLSDGNLTNYKVIHGDNFHHDHETERLDDLPIKSQFCEESVSLIVMGYETYNQFFKRKFMEFVQWLKS